jgi:hypothetical protein
MGKVTNVRARPFSKKGVPSHLSLWGIFKPGFLGPRARPILPQYNL